MPSETFLRPRITKFFEPCHWESHKRGSFWFGTLEKYRLAEDKDLAGQVEPRFSDPREGLVEDTFKVDGGHIPT